MANPRSASSLVGAADVRNSLVDLEGARGFFSGKLIDYSMPCTASEDRTCEIVANLSVWNEFLCPLYLELRELPETGRQLGLMYVVNGSHSVHMKCQLRQATTVLYWLLSTHHCVARIHIGHMFASKETAELCLPVLCNTLDGNYSLKSVVLDSCFLWVLKSDEIEKFFKIILSLKCLEAVELPCCYPSLCARSVTAILRSTTTLTVLDWSSVQEIESTLARRFLRVLRTNSTLRDLSLSEAVIRADTALFFEFLTGDARLQHLRVVYICCRLPDDSLRWILKAMVKNRSVSTLEVKNMTWVLESVELVLKVLAENRVLRSFHVPSHNYVQEAYTGFLMRLRMPPNTTALQDAIARNSTLHYLTLSVSIWSAEHWAPFFRGLSNHASLKMVTINVGVREEYRLLSDVVKFLRESGSEKKVSFNAPYVAHELTVSDCKHFSELNVEVSDRTAGRLLPLSEQLSTFTRLKALSLTFRTCDSVIFYAISEYVATTSTLRMLYVDLTMRIFPPALTEWCLALSRSLLLNRSIVALSIGVHVESSQNIDLLGDAVMRSPTIRKLTLMSFHPLALHAFLRGLRTDISKNYTLCSVIMGHSREFSLATDSFAVWDASRRNSGFVARAAQFLNHARCDRLCAAGLDRVSRHPALVAELSEVLSIGEDEAALMVRRGFRSIEGLHEFMRLAGVVKQRVTCQPREDGRTQLDDLNSECWCHVRRYLQLDDVAPD